MTGQWSTADVAEHLGVTPASVRSYLHRGYLPAPSGRLGPMPWWDPDVIVAWQAARVGQGVGGGQPRKT